MNNLGRWRKGWDSNPRIDYYMLVDVSYGRYRYVTSTPMASITKKLRSKYWFACFQDLHGRQHRRSTGQTDRKKALEIARHYELVAQRRLKPQRVRETLSELYHQIYGESIPSAAVAAVRHQLVNGKRARDGTRKHGGLSEKRREVSSVSGSLR